MSLQLMTVSTRHGSSLTSIPSSQKFILPRSPQLSESTWLASTWYSTTSLPSSLNFCSLICRYKLPFIITYSNFDFHTRGKFPNRIRVNFEPSFKLFRDKVYWGWCNVFEWDVSINFKCHSCEPGVIKFSNC